MIVYSIRNRQTGKEYIGSTIRTMALRWYDHLSACFTKHKALELYDDMRALGVDAFEVVQVESVDTYEALLARERAYIAQRDTLQPNGYNRVKGGRGNLGWKPTAETRENMSRWQRGRRLSESTRAKLSKIGIGNKRAAGQRGRIAWNRGLSSSEETRAKLRAAAAGKPWSEKERSGHVGLKRTPESKALIAQRKREWWASLDYEARTAHIRKMTGKG